MPSPAATKYKSLSDRAALILQTARIRTSWAHRQALYGAAFVAEVAAWNAYVAGIVDCFFQQLANPLASQFHAMHSLARAAAESKLDRFNTPNAENARSLIIACTGYDPWGDWQWPARSMSALATRSRLNEILKVRHSLAHGFVMPGYAWTQSASGDARLTLASLAWTHSFLNQLVLRTDRGLQAHMTVTYHVTPGW
jgi:alcohol dehydrogenase class IV